MLFQHQSGPARLGCQSCQVFFFWFCFLFFSVLMVKTLSLDLIIQVGTTQVCARAALEMSKAMPWCYRSGKVLLSCSDLPCLWERFWSGSHHLVLRSSALQVNHFEPGTGRSPRETRRPIWVEQGNKSTCSSFFLWHYDFILVSC